MPRAMSRWPKEKSIFRLLFVQKGSEMDAGRPNQNHWKGHKEGRSYVEAGKMVFNFN